jgi:putative ABC transport system substrate-binding protein
MKRREFITLIGGAAVSWPPAASAQQAAMPIVGFLSSWSPNESEIHAAAFRRGLSETGFVSGRNVAIEYRWAEGHYERLSGLANELVGLRVSVLVTVGGSVSALAARPATATIPIVFVMGDDPVKLGIVASFNRPGGNFTGVALLTGELGSTRSSNRGATCRCTRASTRDMRESLSGSAIPRFRKRGRAPCERIIHGPISR